MFVISRSSGYLLSLGPNLDAAGRVKQTSQNLKAEYRISL